MSLKFHARGQWDGSVGKGTHFQSLIIWLQSWDPHSTRRELIPHGPVTSTFMHGTCTCTHAQNCNVMIFELLSPWEWGGVDVSLFLSLSFDFPVGWSVWKLKCYSLFIVYLFHSVLGEHGAKWMLYKHAATEKPPGPLTTDTDIVNNTWDRTSGSPHLATWRNLFLPCL